MMDALDIEAVEKRFTSMVLHKDASLVCINKPAGLLAQPDASGVPSAATLAQRWLTSTGQGGVVLPVHRLDRRVTGCLLLARSHGAAARLSAAFAAMEVTKHYLGVTCRGSPAARGIVVGEARRLLDDDA